MTDPLAHIFPPLPLVLASRASWQPQLKVGHVRSVQRRARLCAAGPAELPPGLTSLLARDSETSDLCRDPQARAGSEPDTVKQLQQTEPEPAEQTKALRAAPLPHHTFGQAGKGLDSFISQTVPAQTTSLKGFLQYIADHYLMSIMILTCQIL